MIYGTALLAACMLAGRWLGAILAATLGLDANVGGVGFAMVALMAAMAGLRRAGLATPSFQAGRRGSPRSSRSSRHGVADRIPLFRHSVGIDPCPIIVVSCLRSCSFL